MKLLVRPKTKTGVYQQITSEKACWNWLNFEARLMKKEKNGDLKLKNMKLGLYCLEEILKWRVIKETGKLKMDGKMFSVVWHIPYISLVKQFLN
tara:strand:+ start:211 stop:492 length:282 start_codon:yes stop_codon:yes gene_type:complete